jgi:hypothetical protein
MKCVMEHRIYFNLHMCREEHEWLIEELEQTAGMVKDKDHDLPDNRMRQRFIAALTQPKKEPR